MFLVGWGLRFLSAKIAPAMRSTVFLSFISEASVIKDDFGKIKKENNKFDQSVSRRLSVDQQRKISSAKDLSLFLNNNPLPDQTGIIYR